ncbi:hypothetical protein J3R83DRAFT_11234 [Lanmaoa asiatica]|nr:hypothetical protein J3R83DRAFT_11234 [Lanmaoa asiatica]
MFKPPYPPYDPLDKSGYETVVKRWPIITTNIISHVHHLIHDMTMESRRLTESGEDTLGRAKELEDKVEEGKGIISKASRLKYRMARDQELEQIPNDGDVDVDVYNAELAELEITHQNTWFTAPWLYAECVVKTFEILYRLFRSYFNETRQWRNFDPFFAQKEEMFKNSGTAIYQIATTMHELESEKERLRSDPDKLLDLSLLTHLTPSDIEQLQTVGMEAQRERQEFILKDDQEAVWEYIKTLGGPGKRCDFVLDNGRWNLNMGSARFAYRDKRLFTDFVFADFLVTHTPYFSKVVFHPKLFPWFVSDVTPTDFESTIACLLSTTFFPEPLFSSTKSAVHLEQMVTRWRSYLEQGIFILSTDLKEVNGQKVDGQALAKFWTEPWPYWNMKERASQLWNWLHDSDLVIFKSSERFRLTGDVKWPVSTSFTAALGPLAGAFPLLSLRTNKADVAVGISEQIADELDGRGEKWRVSGKYALVSFERRAG